MNEVFTDEEIKTKIVFVSPDYPARLRNDCYGKKLLSLHNKNLGLPMELEDSFAPFLFIMDKDLCVKYLHIHNKPLPRLTLIYLEEIKNVVDLIAVDRTILSRRLLTRMGRRI